MLKFFTILATIFFAFLGFSTSVDYIQDGWTVLVARETTIVGVIGVISLIGWFLVKYVFKDK
jgi:Na+/glutamate symporter